MLEGLAEGRHGAGWRVPGSVELDDADIVDALGMLGREDAHLGRLRLVLIQRPETGYDVVENVGMAVAEPPQHDAGGRAFGAEECAAGIDLNRLGAVLAPDPGDDPAGPPGIAVAGDLGVAVATEHRDVGEVVEGDVAGPSVDAYAARRGQESVG